MDAPLPPGRAPGTRGATLRRGLASLPGRARRAPTRRHGGRAGEGTP
ncbi:DUF6380 family protein [Streptomyces sp. NEAU-W12]